MSHDHMPNCAIILYYYRGPEGPEQSPSSRFSYCCTSCSQGWQVQSNGSIHPPSRRRIVQIRLNAYLSTAKFAGFQMGAMHASQSIDVSYWTPRAELESLGVRPLMKRYPRKNTTTWTTQELVFDMTDATDRLAYRLAVSVDGDPGPDWDDPRIYDDGSQ